MPNEFYVCAVSFVSPDQRMRALALTTAVAPAPDFVTAANVATFISQNPGYLVESVQTTLVPRDVLRNAVASLDRGASDMAAPATVLQLVPASPSRRRGRPPKAKAAIEECLTNHDGPPESAA